MKSCMMMCALLLGVCLSTAAATRTLAATSRSSASLTIVGTGSGNVVSKCSAVDGWTADCDADATASHGGHAQAVSKGDARKGDVSVKSLAVALDSGDTAVLAKAVADGAGDALAFAIADGVKAGGGKRTRVIASIAKVVAEEGCPAVEPALAVAFVKASDGGYLRTFADAFDQYEDVQVRLTVARCLYPKCIDDRWHCCKDSSDWRCAKKGYGTFKSTPQTIYSCEGCEVTHCLCYE